MEMHNKVGWVVAILIFVLGMGWVLAGDSLYYGKLEITPAIDAVYELVPLSPAQAFGALLHAAATFAIVAFFVAAIARLYILET